MRHAQGKLGYRVVQSQDSRGQTFDRLDIIIEACPTEEHYDPETLRVTIVNPRSGGSTLLLVRHPPAFLGSRFRVCPGQVQLEDRKHKAVAFFTFGGQLTVDREIQRTRCSLCSTAPIINFRRDSTPSALAERSLLLMARRRAAHGRDRSRYEERLCSVDPFVLYAATLLELRRRFEEIPYRRRCMHVQHFLTYLNRTIRSTRQEPDWPRTVPPIDALL